MLNANHSVRCICQICTCGKHHCPPTRRVQQHVPFNGDSCYRLDYKELPLSHREVAKGRRGDIPLVPIKFEGNSTNRLDFKPFEIHVEPASSIKYVPRKPAVVPFAGQSTNHSDYVPYQLERKEPKPPPPRSQDASIKFDATSSYRATFTPKSLPSVPQVDRIVIQRAVVPFTGNSTSHQDYVPHEVQRRVRPALASDKERPSVPFEGNSSNREDYKYPPPRTPVQYVERPKLAVRASVPHDWTTTSKKDYVQHPLDALRASHPVASSSFKPGNLPFEGTSMHRDDYRDWGICPSLKLPQVPTERPNVNHLYFDETDGKWQM